MASLSEKFAAFVKEQNVLLGYGLLGFAMNEMGLRVWSVLMAIIFGYLIALTGITHGANTGGITKNVLIWSARLLAVFCLINWYFYYNSQLEIILMNLASSLSKLKGLWTNMC